MILGVIIATRGELIGSAYGVAILSGFAALWAVLAAHAVRKLELRTWVAIILVTGLLCWGAMRRMSLGYRLPPEAPVSAQKHAISAWQRSFEIVLMFEWIPIIAVVVIFNRMKRPEYIAPAIAVIVGLHFLPLAEIFDSKIYYVTGAAMIGAGILPIPIRSAGMRKAITCGCCAAILWVTAALMLT